MAGACKLAKEFRAISSNGAMEYLLKSYNYTIGVQLWYYTNVPLMMHIGYYDRRIQNYACQLEFVRILIDLV